MRMTGRRPLGTLCPLFFHGPLQAGPSVKAALCLTIQDFPNRDDHRGCIMAKGEQRSNKMAKKPKKDTTAPKTFTSDRPMAPTTFVAPRGKVKPA